MRLLVLVKSNSENCQIQANNVCLVCMSVCISWCLACLACPVCLVCLVSCMSCVSCVSFMSCVSCVQGCLVFRVSCVYFNGSYFLLLLGAFQSAVRNYCSTTIFIRIDFFINRLANFWNDLSSAVVNASSLSVIKSLRKVWLSFQCSITRYSLLQAWLTCLLRTLALLLTKLD